MGFLKETGAMPRFEWPEPPAADTAVTVRSVLEPIEAVSPAHTLSNFKWEKQMTSSRCDGLMARKLCRLDGMARTLVSNYRKCFYTEFVPYQNPDGTFLDHQVRDAMIAPPPPRLILLRSPPPTTLFRCLPSMVFTPRSGFRSQLPGCIRRQNGHRRLECGEWE